LGLGGRRRTDHQHFDGVTDCAGRLACINHISSTKQILSWRKIPITLIMALRWALECNGLFSTVESLLHNGRVPIYRFHVDVDVPPAIAAQRIQAVVQKGATFWGSFRTAWRLRYPSGPPFIGTVQDNSFKVRRDIRYRNSFLPMIWGRLISIPTGTRVRVTMFLHPLVAVFMVVWLGFVGRGALFDRSGPPVFLWGMFVFGIVLVTAGFIPEVITARRLITVALKSAAANAVQVHPVG